MTVTVIDVNGNEHQGYWSGKTYRREDQQDSANIYLSTSKKVTISHEQLDILNDIILQEKKKYNKSIDK